MGPSIYDVRWLGGGGSAVSDFISKGSLTKHLMRGEGTASQSGNSGPFLCIGTVFLVLAVVEPVLGALLVGPGTNTPFVA